MMMMVEKNNIFSHYFHFDWLDVRKWVLVIYLSDLERERERGREIFCCWFGLVFGFSICFYVYVLFLVINKSQSFSGYLTPNDDNDRQYRSIFVKDFFSFLFFPIYLPVLLMMILNEMRNGKKHWTFNLTRPKIQKTESLTQAGKFLFKTNSTISGIFFLKFFFKKIKIFKETVSNHSTKQTNSKKIIIIIRKSNQKSNQKIFDAITIIIIIIFGRGSSLPKTTKTKQKF